MTDESATNQGRDEVSLDVYILDGNGREFEANITHNLAQMAREAGIYECLWRPDEIDVHKAGQLIEPLRSGVRLLTEQAPRFEAFDADNGWGTYHDFLPFVARYLSACIANPDGDVRVSR